MASTVVTAVKSARRLLLFTASTAIQHGVLQAHQRVTKGKNPIEPAIVASLVFDTLPLLQCLWAPVLASQGIALKVSGVFCHMSPKVKWPTSAPQFCCELGDLLVVHSHRSFNGNTDLRAVLFQAKKTKNGKACLNGKELVQLALYQQLPRFVYDSVGYPSGVSRRIENRTSNPLRYLLVQATVTGLSPRSCAHAYAAQPARVVVPWLPLEESLVRLLTGKIGRRVILSETDGWSQVVKDILSGASQTTFSLKAAGYRRGDRWRLWESPSASTPLHSLNGLSLTKDQTGIGIGDMSAIQNVLDGANGEWNGGKAAAANPDEPSGASVILLETSDKEGR